MNSIVILSNGLFPTEAYPLFLLDSAEGVVCCDGAFEKWRERYPSRLPLAIVGDMDSLSPALQASLVSIIVKEDEQDGRQRLRASPERGPRLVRPPS